MDQAKTLRHLLGRKRATVNPILGDMACDYAACLGRFILEQQAQLNCAAVLFDGSVCGLRKLLPSGSQSDLIEFFNGQSNLEDLVLELAKNQYLVLAAHGFQVLSQNTAYASTLLRKFHRMPVNCDRYYVTLSYEAVSLARVFSPRDDWYWVVQPTAKSVTRAFQAIRTSKGLDETIQHRVIVAGVKDANEADHVFANLSKSASSWLARPLQYVGHLPALSTGKALNQVGREMVASGRRIAKAICSLDEYA